MSDSAEGTRALDRRRSSQLRVQLTVTAAALVAFVAAVVISEAPQAVAKALDVAVGVGAAIAGAAALLGAVMVGVLALALAQTLFAAALGSSTARGAPPDTPSEVAASSANPLAGVPVTIDSEAAAEVDSLRAMDDFAASVRGSRASGRRRLVRELAEGAVDAARARLAGQLLTWPSADAHPAVVNTGFSGMARPGRPWRVDRPLLCDRRYHVWMEIGPPVVGSIESRAEPLPPLPAGTALRVVLFPCGGDVRVIKPGSGHIALAPDGSSIVTIPAASGRLIPHELARRRLFFTIKTPSRPAIVRLRCSVYRGQVLVQSRLIEAAVERAGARASTGVRQPALVSTLDYCLSRVLDPRLLAQLPEHRMSLMLNGSDGTHSLHAVASDGRTFTARTATFGEGKLQDQVKRARQALRNVAYGSPEPWHEGARYRYSHGELGGASDARDRLRGDLARLAINGWRFYDACVATLAGGEAEGRTLASYIVKPAFVQIALKHSAELVLPSALFYDIPVDTSTPMARIRLCDAFVEALDGKAPLADAPCFRGACPTRAAPDLSTVCPSGFWGFRHFLGMPVSLLPEPGVGDPQQPAEPAVTIWYQGHPALHAAVSMDKRFTRREDHLEALHRLFPDPGYHCARNLQDTLSGMRDTPAHLVYFYCHGGLADGLPYLALGEDGGPPFTSDMIRAYSIVWEVPRPLVFINGCHTVAVEPEQAFNFVSRLVETAGAAGVIGTEISNFEDVAQPFAETCIAELLAGRPVGEALRTARLALLHQENPLGLLYTAFVLPTTQLSPAAAMT